MCFNNLHFSSAYIVFFILIRTHKTLYKNTLYYMINFLIGCLIFLQIQSQILQVVCLQLFFIGIPLQYKHFSYNTVQIHSFSLQELLKQFLLVYRYCTSYFRSNKKDEYTSYRIAFIFLYLLGLDTDFSFCFNIQNIFFLIGIWITFSLFVY